MQQVLPQRLQVDAPYAIKLTIPEAAQTAHEARTIAPSPVPLAPLQIRRKAAGNLSTLGRQEEVVLSLIVMAN